MALELLEVDLFEKCPYETYLAGFAERSRIHLGKSLGTQEAERFRADNQRVVGLVESWLDDEHRAKDSALVLGHVQSGKTAHILGMLAWASMADITCAVVASGATTALRNQTANRLVDQLGPEGLDAALVWPDVPTQRHEAAVDEIVDRLRDICTARAAGELAPLPVLCVMKNKARLGGVASILDRLGESMEKPPRVLFVDDEVDHVSQNSHARARRESAAYAELKRWRERSESHFYVGFTATPQAALLTERLGAVRPRRVVVLGTGVEYFGIERALDSAIKVVVEGASAEQRRFELRDALRCFLIGAAIRRSYPDEFYSAGPVSVLATDRKPMSVQMLIHPSGKKIDHAEYLDLAQRALLELEEELTDVSQRGERDNWEDAYVAIRNRVREANPDTCLPGEFSDAFRKDILTVLRDQSATKVVVVNSDRDLATKLPSTDEEWEEAAQWVVIGGDVVGRGVTLPQLLVMFYLRNPRSRTFDTSVQQARFCGYRRSYEALISIWAPDDIFDAYAAMVEINDALFSCARRWEAEARDLVSQPPVVVFVSNPSDQRMEPTRRAVLDPNVYDVSTRAILFQSQQAHEPSVVFHNAKFIDQFVSDNQLEAFDDSGWCGLVDIPFSDARDFLKKWQVLPGVERARLSRTSEVLDLEIGTLGLQQRPVSILIRNAGEIRELATGKIPTLERKRSLFPVNAGVQPLAWDRWADAFRARPRTVLDHLPPMKAYVGHVQRVAQAKLANGDTAILIEPLNVTLGDNRRVGIALVLAVMAPNGYLVRTVGMSEA